MPTSNYRWRKVTNINRRHALFELLDGDVPLLYAGFADQNKFEVAFNPSMGGKIMDCEELLKLLQEVKILADEDI